MSNPSGLTMTLSNSASSPQTTSLNSVAVMSTLMTNLSMAEGPDRLTSLTTELLQQVASNLSAHSIITLRTMNKAAAAKTFPNFVETCLHSLTIQTTKVGVKQALKYLQIQGASKATTHVTFTSSPTADGLKSTSLAGLPSQAELKALLAQLPNATSFTIRENTEHSLESYNICCLLATLSAPLTELTLDGCSLPGSTLSRLLSVHSGTLSYVALRNVQLLTKSTPFKSILTMLLTNCSLDRLVLASLSEGDVYAKTISLISRQALDAQRVPADYVTRAWTGRSGKPQEYTLAEDLASMTGTDGVRAGLRGVITGRFRFGNRP